jgi:hypothetical protein
MTAGAQPAWTHIPQAALDLLFGAFRAWETAYENTVGPHTPVQTEAKYNAKKAAKKTVRPFINQYLRHLPVTDADRTAMGIPNRDTVRTRIGKPKTVPVFGLVIKGIRKVTVPFHDEETDRRGIPYGMGGALVSWKVSDAPIDDPEQLERSALATKSPAVIHFEEADRGKIVSVALRWQNKNSTQGDTSATQSTVVP